MTKLERLFLACALVALVTLQAIAAFRRPCICVPGYEEVIIPEEETIPEEAPQIAANTYGLTPPQWTVYTHPARFRVLVAGRRFGKTVLAVNELLRAAQVGEKRNVWYVAPTYRQAKQICWLELKDAIPPEMIAKKDETDLSITLKGFGSTISLRGADNPDSLRGVGLDFIALDEYQDTDPLAWELVLRPALSDRQGEALFIGTPKGHNHFYDLYMYALTSSNPEWAAWQYTTAQGGNVSQTEISEARRTMDPKTFRQEYEASFETFAGRFFYNFSRELIPAGNVGPVEDQRGALLLVGMDFNVNPMTVLLAVKAVDELHLFDEIVLPNSNTTETSQVLAQRYGKYRGGDGAELDRDILIFPDPACKQRSTNAAAGETDLTILRRHGWKIALPQEGVIPVVDSANEVNSLLLNSAGRRRLVVNPKCRNLVKTLDGLGYREGTNLPDKSGGLDHAGDALRYLVHGTFPMISRRAVVAPLSRKLGIR